ncbi:putative kinase, GHMP family [Methylococcus capsulatus str. Bath]|nr:putative kinase, GHMP family [Methylococcus capsulatus str. Bath]QXP92006.1 GHMP kinase [Methylococcus capsulatus]
MRHRPPLADPALHHPNAMPKPSPRVRVHAPARLHLGFIDISGTFGRRFGSIGVAIDDIATRLSLWPSREPRAAGPSAEKALAILEKIEAALSLPGSATVEIESAIPEHVGLGSGTQMALALGSAIIRAYGLPLTPRDLAPLIERGARSGIGLASFEQGGLIVDGGRGPETLSPPVVARLPVPEDWRFILVFDSRGQGLHGKQEIDAFQTLPPFPEQDAARLSHLILMQTLPALAEQRLETFGAGIAEIQRSVGDYFAPAQGGRFTSPGVAAALDWLATQGAVGIGQSSWGPTGFCLVASEPEARRLAAAAANRNIAAHLDFRIARPRNRGADVTLAIAAPEPASLQA